VALAAVGPPLLVGGGIALWRRRSSESQRGTCSTSHLTQGTRVKLSVQTATVSERQRFIASLDSAPGRLSHQVSKVSIFVRSGDEVAAGGRFIQWLLKEQQAAIDELFRLRCWSCSIADGEQPGRHSRSPWKLGSSGLSDVPARREYERPLARKARGQ